MHASTIHALFQFDDEYKTKLEIGKQTQSEVELTLMEVLLLDEVSMLDEPCFAGICHVMSMVDHSRRPAAREADCFGQKHLLMFGDFKQELAIYSYEFFITPSRRRVSTTEHLLPPLVGKTYAVLQRAGHVKATTPGCRRASHRPTTCLCWIRPDQTRPGPTKEIKNWTPVTASKRSSTFRRSPTILPGL